MDIRQAVSSRILNHWLNKGHIDLKNVEKFRREFQNQKPFPNLEINDFIKKELAVELLKALSEEKFYPKEADLFKFSQTNDFVSTENDILKEFRSFLMSDEFISFIIQLVYLFLYFDIELLAEEIMKLYAWKSLVFSE